MYPKTVIGYKSKEIARKYDETSDKVTSFNESALRMIHFAIEQHMILVCGKAQNLTCNYGNKTVKPKDLNYIIENCL